MALFADKEHKPDPAYVGEALIADHLSLALHNQVLTERLSASQADTDEQFAMGDARVKQLTDRLLNPIVKGHTNWC